MSGVPGVVVVRRWSSPYRRRWLILMKDIQSVGATPTEEEVLAWIDSEWLTKVLSPKSAEKARCAFRNEGTYSELVEEFGGSTSQYGVAVRATFECITRLYRALVQKQLYSPMPGVVYPSIDAPIDVAVVAGLAKASHLDGVAQLHTIKFKNMHLYCEAPKGLQNSNLTMALSEMRVRRICMLCQYVHKCNGTPCGKVKRRCKHAPKVQSVSV